MSRLQLAVEYGRDAEILQIWEEFGEVVDLDQAVVLASYFNRWSTIKLLIGLGASIDVEEGDLIDTACMKGNLEMVQWLHSRGARLDLTTQPAILAAARGKLAVLQWLWSNGVEIIEEECDAFYSAVSNDQIHVVEWMLQFPIPVEYLEIASEHSQEMRELILSHWNSNRKKSAYA